MRTQHNTDLQDQLVIQRRLKEMPCCPPSPFCQWNGNSLIANYSRRVPRMKVKASLTLPAVCTHFLPPPYSIFDKCFFTLYYVPDTTAAVTRIDRSYCLMFCMCLFIFFHHFGLSKFGDFRQLQTRLAFILFHPNQDSELYKWEGSYLSPEAHFEDTQTHVTWDSGSIRGGTWWKTSHLYVVPFISHCATPIPSASSYKGSV